jgi:hypothetical protein
MVRGGGSVAARAADLSMEEDQAAGCSMMMPAGSATAIPGGMIGPGQTAAQFGEQFWAQQSIPR